MRRLATNLVTYITEMIGGNPGFAAIMVCAAWVLRQPLMTAEAGITINAAQEH